MTSLVLRAGLSLPLVAAAMAAPVAYDGFGNAPLADLNGSSGGAGWTSPWVDLTSGEVSSVALPGLTYPRLPTMPGAVVTPASAVGYGAADYNRTFPVPAGNDMYISFLLRPDNGYGSAGLSFGTYLQVGVPLTLSTYGLRLGRYLFVDSGVPVVQGETKLLVLHIAVSGATTTFKLYVNPNLAQGEPAAPSAVQALGGVVKPGFIELMNDGGFTTDEIRVATTWADATTPPPCPADLDNGTMTGTPDGGVDINDLLYFLTVYEMGSVRADLDNGTMTGTPDGGVDINDLLFFMARYEAGC